MSNQNTTDSLYYTTKTGNKVKLSTILSKFTKGQLATVARLYLSGWNRMPRHLTKEECNKMTKVEILNYLVAHADNIQQGQVYKYACIGWNDTYFKSKNHFKYLMDWIKFNPFPYSSVYQKQMEEILRLEKERGK